MDSPIFFNNMVVFLFFKNKRFLNLKIYQYFTHNIIYNDDKRHLKIGISHFEIIKKMIKEKNEAYITIMKSTTEEMLGSFKNNEKYIIKIEKLIDFKNLDDAFIEIQNSLDENILYEKII